MTPSRRLVTSSLVVLGLSAVWTGYAGRVRHPLATAALGALVCASGIWLERRPADRRARRAAATLQAMQVPVVTTPHATYLMSSGLFGAPFVNYAAGKVQAAFSITFGAGVGGPVHPAATYAAGVNVVAWLLAWGIGSAFGGPPQGVGHVGRRARRDGTMLGDR